MIKKILFTFAIFLTTVSFVQAQQDINVQGNSIDILDGDTTPDLADHTDFGSVAVGSSVIRTFTIQNVGNVDLNLASIGKTIGTNAQFTVDISSVATPVAASGGFTTFTVTYTPTITGLSTGGIIIGSDSPAPEDSYTFSIQAEGIAGATPDINLQGNGVDILDGDTTPNLADHTNFGSVPVGSSVTRIFTIQNVGSSDLNLSAVGKSIGTNAQFTVDISSVATPVIGGSFTTFTVTYTPTTAGVSTGGIVIGSDSPAPENPYTFSIQAEGTAAGAQDINVQGNGIDILDGDTTPDLGDHTDFGEVTIGSPLTRTFTIQNTGGADLNLTAVNLALGTNAQFSIDNSAVSTPIIGGGFTMFTVTFTPTVVGVVTGQVRIVSDDPDGESTYTFDIQAEGKDIVSAGSKLLITQYYEGSGANDQWIEIKNISSDPILGGAYFLALYTNFQTLVGSIDINPPSPGNFIAIGAMAAGEVRLYSNLSASLPSAGNRGSVTPIQTGACNFNGNDVILISTSTGANCYNDRIDIMGVVGTVSPPFWGQNIGYVKGCGTIELPTLEFDVITVPGIGITAGDYVRVNIEDVDVVDDTNTNIALGTQVLGSTEWNGAWTNLQPDRTRDVLISANYTAANGSFTTCNLNVTGTLNLDGGTSNYVDVHKNLTITGSFTIGDTESLYFDADNEGAVITGAITKKETTTQLTNINDFTYWSSPVTNETINSVFAANNLNRVYYWDQQAANTVPGGGTEALGEWFVASGTMKPGVGYISEGPIAGTYPLNQTIDFTGKPNNGVVIVSGTPHMYYNNDDPNNFNDFNVVGNPYPSAIDADVFLTEIDNSDIDATIWFWTHSTPYNTNPDDADNKYTSADFASYNLTGGVGTGAPAGNGIIPNQYIGSGQGFMVRALANTPGAVFNNAMRVKDQNTQFFRGSDSKKSSTDDAKDRVWLNMEAEGGSYNQILLGFFENATDNFDRGYDGLKNGVGWASFYSTIETDTMKYSIQGLNAFNVDKKIILGFDTYINEDVLYKISIDKIEGTLTENDVYIVDNELNVTHDLKLSPYEFNFDKEGNYPERFTLQFTKSTLGTDDFNLNNNFVVLNEDNGLRVKSSTPVSTIQVFDVTGRLLVNSKPNASEFVIDSRNIKKGTILILNATFENGAKLSKKAINY